MRWKFWRPLVPRFDAPLGADTVSVIRQALSDHSGHITKLYDIIDRKRAVAPADDGVPLDGFRSILQRLDRIEAQSFPLWREAALAARRQLTKPKRRRVKAIRKKKRGRK